MQVDHGDSHHSQLAVAFWRWPRTIPQELLTPLQAVELDTHEAEWKQVEAGWTFEGPRATNQQTPGRPGAQSSQQFDSVLLLDFKWELCLPAEAKWSKTAHEDVPQKLQNESIAIHVAIQEAKFGEWDGEQQ